MKRFINSLMVFAMVLTLVGAVVPAQATAASAGDLIKTAENSAVYYLASDGKRYVFPNQKTYYTWYGNDFSDVVTISMSEMSDIQLGGNIPYKAGTRMIKLNNDAKVYTLEPGGLLRHVPSEAVAADLFGSNWNTKIDDMPDSFFASTYTYGDALTTMYPTGSIVKEEGGATVYYIDGTEKRPIADESAFNANGFMWEFLQTGDLSAYTAGSSITGEESEITVPVGEGSATPGDASTGTLTVSLAADTPASTTIVENATWVKFTKFNLTATGGDVVVDSIQIKRGGLAQDSNFSNVYLLDGDEMHGNEKTLSSNHTAYVTQDLTITNGQTKSLYIAATMHSSLNAGETASLGISEVNVKGSASVSGTLPFYGNEMNMNGTIAIGTVTPADGGLTTTATKPVGTTDYTFASLKLTTNSTEDVQVERIRFYQSGTAADDDTANLDLLVDGTVLATVAEANDKYVDFDLSSSPYTISKGQNKTFELRGDIVDGSSRTIDFEVYNKADLLVKGKTYGFYISPSYTNTSAPYWTNDYPTTVSTGTLTVSKAVLDSTNVAEGATQQEIGAFYFHAQGEPVIVTQMVMNVVTSTSPQTGEITNITVYDEDGDVVAGPQDKADAATDTVTFTDTFTVPTGINKYIVKGDLDSNFSANATVYMQFATPATKVTAKGEVTNNAITPTPASNINGDTVSIKTADLNVSTSSSPAAQSVAAGTSGYVFSRFVLDASQSGEDVKVTQLQVKHTSSAYNIHSYITGITLYDGTTALNSPVAGESSTTVSTATSTITLTNPLIITKGTTKTLTLKADISGSAANGSTHQFGLVGAASVTSYGNATGNSITEDVTNSDGQTMTITSAGELRMANAGANPAEGLILADSTNTMGVFNFEALYEDIEVQKLGFTISSGDYINIDSLELYVGSTLVGSVPVSGANATITPADLLIPQSTNKTLTLKAKTNKVGEFETGTSGASIVVTLTGMEAKGKSTGSTSVTQTGLNTTTTNTQYIYKTKPTIEKVNLSGMSNTVTPLYSFTVTADSKGDLGFYKASFSITTTSATVTNFELYEDDVLVSPTTLSDGLEIVTASSGGTGGTYVINALFDTNASGVAAGGEHRTIGAGETKTYVLKGSVTGWASGDSINVSMLGDNAAPTVAKAVTVDTAASDNFIWSDMNYTWNTTTATQTAQWINGYKVIATTSQSF